MVRHMKTTIEISDAVLEQARELAAREGLTLREVVEAGLRRLLAEDPGGKSFTLRDASVGGRGLQPGIKPGSWEQIRDLIYEGRGA